ncbi:helix-turn-helix transcriptional regulator [Natrarchaeobius sp. A-rgal3]|uniref:helix-turn-helix transcriptional regulator n=1 Tax=Natrarchaeobius versutus TaxID=1679078 RepID=UPI00350FD261
MNGGQLDDVSQVLGRADVLDACRDEPRSRGALVEELERSRATIYRVTNDLEDDGLLESTPRGYRTTTTGAVILEAARRAVDAVQATDRLEPLLSAVDSPELAANAHLLTDAEIVVATKTDPYAPNDRALELWMDSDRVLVGMRAIGTRESIVEGAAAMFDLEMDVEMCVTPAVFETFRNVTPDLLERSHDAETVSMRVVEDVPFSFAVHEDVVTVVANDDTGIPTVLAVSDSEAAHAWLDGLFETVRTRAIPASDFLERDTA